MSEWLSTLVTLYTTHIVQPQTAPVSRLVSGYTKASSLLYILTGYILLSTLSVREEAALTSHILGFRSFDLEEKHNYAEQQKDGH